MDSEVINDEDEDNSTGKTVSCAGSIDSIGDMTDVGGSSAQEDVNAQIQL